MKTSNIVIWSSVPTDHTLHMLSEIVHLVIGNQNSFDQDFVFLFETSFFVGAKKMFSVNPKKIQLIKIVEY